jgi:hypothetical protein
MASDFTPSGGPPKAVVNPFSWPESQVTEWSTTEDEREARASALDAGRIHGEHLAELARIKDEAGPELSSACFTIAAPSLRPTKADLWRSWTHLGTSRTPLPGTRPSRQST